MQMLPCGLYIIPLLGEGVDVVCLKCRWRHTRMLFKELTQMCRIVKTEFVCNFFTAQIE